MKPPAFAYHDPETVDDALGLLAGLENARLLAGGQSLMPMLNMRFLQPDHLIDLNRIGALAGIKREGDTVNMGAMTRQHALESDAELRLYLPIMAEALAQVGHRQTRNRGTIGGSLCHLDPAAELVSVALALDATVSVRGRSSDRRVPLREFAAAYMTPAIEVGEMVTAVALCVPAAGSGQCFLEFARRHGDFALASVAAILEPDAQGNIARAAIAIGGVGSVPVRLTAAETMLADNRPDMTLFRAAAVHCAELDAQDDAITPGWYRKQLATTLTERALTVASERMRRTGGPH